MGEKVAKTGWRGQHSKKRPPGGPGLPGGLGNRVRDIGEEQTSPATGAQAFA